MPNFNYTERGRPLGTDEIFTRVLRQKGLEMFGREKPNSASNKPVYAVAGSASVSVKVMRAVISVIA